MNSNRTNSDVRAENTSRITRMLYENEKLTKRMIASNLGLSQPTVSTIVDDLSASGLVYLHSADFSSGGRIPLVINFNYSSYYAIGCEITAKTYNVVLIDLRGSVVEYVSGIKSFAPNTEYWLFIADCIRHLIQNNSLSDSKILGVGITLPGIVNHELNCLESAPTLGIVDCDLSNIKNYINYPLFFENEANAAGFSEIWTRPDLDSACYVSINEGVGGALIRDRKIVYGSNYHEGEYGHMILIPGGEKCSCGKNGCFEAYCGLNALTRHSNGSLTQFFYELPNNEKFKSAFDAYLEHLSIGLSNIQLALDLPIVLGGKIAPYLEEDFSVLCEKVNALYPFSNKLNQPLSLGRYKNDSCAIGVALMLVANKLAI